jgi:putative ABC transport system substrate-binding protein
LKDLQAAARKMSVGFLALEVNQPEDYDRAFAEIRKQRPGALIVHGTYTINIHRRRIFDFALRNRLPAIYSQGGWVAAGGLMSYGAHFPDLWRRAATYVDQILKGAKPGDLPIEQPTKFELVINLRTAKALGLTIPPSLLLRADHVIQ